MRGCEHLIKILLMPALRWLLRYRVRSTYDLLPFLESNRRAIHPRGSCSGLFTDCFLPSSLSLSRGVPRECPEWISGAACVHVQRTPRAIRLKCRSRERAGGVYYRRLKNLLAKSCIVSAVNWEISGDRAGDKYGI